MGEDRTSVERPPIVNRYASIVSSCSEDSESTSARRPRDDPEPPEELKYGPGIVNKLRTRFLTISLKQTRGSDMRRSCSMENLLDQDAPDCSVKLLQSNGSAMTQGVPFLKRAKSMDTLLLDLQQQAVKTCDDKKVVVKTREKSLLTICDEELPKPDIVKTYKRMFEPAEPKRGSHCRRPPVLRATARSKTSPCAKLNGVPAKPKQYGAKPTSPVKPPLANGAAKTNGCFVVRAIPARVSKYGQESAGSVNRFATRKEAQFSSPDAICNGKDVLLRGGNRSVAENTPRNGVTCGAAIIKPKVPPNRPQLKFSSRSPSPLDVKVSGKISPPAPKLCYMNGVDEHKNGERPSSNKNSIDANKSLPVRNPSPVEKTKNEIKCVNKVKDEIVFLSMTKSREDIIKCASMSNGDIVLPSVNKIKEEIQIAAGIDKTKIPICNNLKSQFSANAKLKDRISSPTGFKFKDQPDPPLPNGKAESPPPEKQTNCTSDPAETQIANNNKPAIDKTPSKINTESGPSDKTELKCQSSDNNRHSEPNSRLLDKNDALKDCKTDMLGDVDTSNKLVNGHLKKFVEAQPLKDSQKKICSRLVNGDLKTKKQPDDGASSMVFDFRGKDVVAHVAVMPTPFGCKSMHPKKRTFVDGKPLSDDEDEDSVDYSVPPPCGLVFEGENVKVGRGSILAIRNKDLKISFDENINNSTFIYPSETSLLEDSCSPSTSSEGGSSPHPPKLKANTAIGSSAAGLSSYTPSLLRTVDGFEPGMFRPSLPDREQASGGAESGEMPSSGNMLKPADPEVISSWSVSAGTSDLLF